ncbi:MAG: glycosyltransferase family 10 domain-containing protein, partial [Chloroflexota bacterium]
VTEKFFDTLLAGSVPVYLGAPNINQFAPGDRCFIDVADFDEPRLLAEHLLFLSAHPEQFLRYLHWKHQPLPEHFLRFAEISRVDALTRLLLRWHGDRQGSLAGPMNERRR